MQASSVALDWMSTLVKGILGAHLFLKSGKAIFLEQ